MEEVLRCENRAIFVQVKERHGGDIGVIAEYLRRRDGRKGPVLVEHDFFNGLLRLLFCEHSINEGEFDERRRKANHLVRIHPLVAIEDLLVGEIQ